MSELTEAGCLSQMEEEVQFEWQIPNFYQSNNIKFTSPVFYLSDSRWCLRLFPNDDKVQNDSIELFLERKDSGPPKSVKLSLGITKTDGVEFRGTAIYKVPNENDGENVMGPFRFVSKLYLRQRRFQIMPSDVLAITCTLSSADPHSAEVSLLSRLWNLSKNLRTILDEKKGSDFIVKVQGSEFSAHRMILESRSEFFAGMLGNKFQENENNMVEIDDIEKDVFKCILTYLYTGEVDGISCENVGKIYVAADKLLLVELKKFCVDYMKENLNHKVICDAVVIAEQYGELRLEKRALDYFTRYADEIFELDGWKKFKVEKGILVSKLLEKIIVNRLKLIKPSIT